MPGATVFHLDDAGVRVLLGHFSGHHALPALRWDEVFAVERIVADASPGSCLARHVGLLLYGTAWTAADDDLAAVRTRVRDGVRRADVVRPGEKEALVELLARPCDDVPGNPSGAPDVRFAWWQEAPRGWVNNSPYGPRNPRSPFTCERTVADGFARLARWTAALELRARA